MESSVLLTASASVELTGVGSTITFNGTDASLYMQVGSQIVSSSRNDVLAALTFSGGSHHIFGQWHSSLSVVVSGSAVVSNYRANTMIHSLLISNNGSMIFEGNASLHCTNLIVKTGGMLDDNLEQEDLDADYSSDDAVVVDADML
jgi:hypothetical protein